MRGAITMWPRGAVRIMKPEWPACLSLCAGARLRSPRPHSALGEGGYFSSFTKQANLSADRACPKSQGPEVLEWELSSPLSFCVLCPTHESLRGTRAPAPPAPSPQAARPRSLSSPHTVCHRTPCPFVSSWFWTVSESSFILLFCQ